MNHFVGNHNWNDKNNDEQPVPRCSKFPSPIVVRAGFRWSAIILAAANMERIELGMETKQGFLRSSSPVNLLHVGGVVHDDEALLLAPVHTRHQDDGVILLSPIRVSHEDGLGGEETVR